MSSVFKLFIWPGRNPWALRSLCVAGGSWQGRRWSCTWPPAQRVALGCVCAGNAVLGGVVMPSLPARLLWQGGEKLRVACLGETGKDQCALRSAQHPACFLVTNGLLLWAFMTLVPQQCSEIVGSEEGLSGSSSCLMLAWRLLLSSWKG